MTTAGRLAVILALMLFLFFGDAPERSRFWSAFFDAGHAALFGVVAIVVHGWLARRSRYAAGGGWLAAFAIAVIIGAATEVLQTLQARGDPSIADLFRDTAGAAGFLLLARAFSSGRRGSTRWRVTAASLAAAILAAAGWTLMVTSARYVARDRAYPVLFPLDGSWWEASFIDLDGNRLIPGAGPALPGDPGRQPLARLDLVPGLYSGIAFDEPYPDWRGRDRLALTIVSHLETPLHMAIRVHDAAHDQRYRDRFNRRLLIVPGVNDVRIPLEEIGTAPDRRRMDMGRIKGVLLFAYDLKRPVHLYLGPLRLE